MVRMSHRVDTSGSRRLGGFAGRVLAIAAATALCAAAIGLTVSMWGAPAEEPQPVVAPSSSAPSDAPTSSAPVAVAPSTPLVTTPPSTPSPVAPPAPTTTVAPVAPTTATPTRTAPRVTSPSRPRCTPHPQWVYRPSTGSYERITLPC
ncbi:hypothetical protein DVB88_22135 [Tsukamurella pulmonis]|nr:hypothetical protein DVB88_22135 [Tsukamurella pulmonis]